MKTTDTKNTTTPARQNQPFFGAQQPVSAEQEFFFTIQPKLTIGEPTDKFEQEADATADKVVQKMEAPAPTPIDTPSTPPAAAAPPADTPPSDIESTLSSSKGGGAALPPDTRNQMESAFNTDFSAVRIHQDTSATSMNKSLSSHAFTYGSDIYFNSGKFDPSGKDGQHLLAHELTHVVQQTGAQTPATPNNTNPGPAPTPQTPAPQAPSIQKDSAADPKQKIKDETDKNNITLDDADLQFLQQNYPDGILISKEKFIINMTSSTYNSVLKYPGFLVRPATGPASKIDTFIFMVDKGRSILVSAQGGGSILLDAGSKQSNTSGSAAAQRLATALNNVILSGQAAAPSEIKISHMDIDHYNALDDVLRIPALSRAMVQVSRQQLQEATKTVGKDWNRMNVQFQATQSLVQIDVVGGNLRETRAIIGDMEVIEYRSVAAHNALNTATTYNKNNTSAVTVVRDLKSNTTMVYTADAEGRLFSEVVDMVGEDAFRRIIGGGAANLSLVEVPHHGGAVDKGPDARGMVRFYRLAFEASKGKVNFFTQTSPNFSAKTSASINYLRSAGIAIDSINDDPSTTPGTSQVRKATGPARQQITIDAGTLQNIRNLGASGGEDLRSGYEKMAAIDSLLESTTSMEQAYEWMGEPRMPTALRNSRTDLERSKTTLQTNLTSYWSAMETAAGADGMRSTTDTTGVQAAVRAIKTTADATRTQPQADTLNGLVQGMTLQGRLVRNMFEISDAALKGDLARLNTAKSEQTQLMSFARAAVGEKTYNEMVWSTWKEVRESWTNNAEEFTRGLTRIESIRALRADQRMVLNITLARQMDLNELSARAAEGAVPGGGPAPMGSRIGAGVMLFFELARMGLELAASIKQSNEAAAQYAKAVKAQGYQDLSWWQSRGAIPTIALVNREGFWSKKYVEKMTGDDAYKVLREDKSVVAPEFDRVVIKDIKDEDLVAMIYRFNSEFKTVEEWIREMGSPETQGSWFIEVKGRWAVRLWNTAEGDYEYVGREAIQKPLSDLFSHLEENDKARLKEVADQYGTATVKDSALIFGTDRFVYVFNSGGGIQKINLGDINPVISDLGERYYFGDKVHQIRAADETTYRRLSSYYWKREGARYASENCVNCAYQIIEPNVNGYAYIDPKHIVNQKGPTTVQKKADPAQTAPAITPIVAPTPALTPAPKTAIAPKRIQAKFASSEEALSNTKNIESLRYSLILFLRPQLESTMTTTPEQWLEWIARAIKSVLPDDAYDGAFSYGIDVAHLAEPFNGDMITLPSAVQTLRNFEDNPQLGSLDYKYKPRGVDFIFNTLWRDVANHLLGGLQNATPDLQKASSDAYDRLLRDLDVLIRMVRDPLQFMNLELEATVQELMHKRLQFYSFDPGRQGDEQRKAVGQEIGQLAREARMLNDAIQKIPTGQPLSAVPLESVILSKISEIHSIRDTAATEEATKAAYKDDPGLLSKKTVTVNNPLLPEPTKPQADRPEPAPDNYQFQLTPDEAFPESTENATNQFMDDLNDRILTEKKNVNEQKQKIFPEHPNYDMKEFVAMYRRWYAFISHENEKQDPIYAALTQTFMGIENSTGQGAYQLMGIPMDFIGSNVSGAIARSYMMMFSADMLGSHVAYPSGGYYVPTLAENNARQRSREVSGSASRPDYQYGSFFGDPGLFPYSANMEDYNRRSYAQSTIQDRSNKFNAVAKADFDDQPQEAIDQGILSPNADKVPIVGMKETQARDGWNFLVSVFTPGPYPALVAREQKTMPTDVSEYLMARQQLHSTLSQKHFPTYNGAPVGDSGITGDFAHPGGGVEGGKGVSKETYVEGQANPEPSRQSRQLQNTLYQTTDDAKMSSPFGDYNQKITGELINEMAKWFEQFYTVRQEAFYRVTTVLTVSNIEFGLAERVKELLDPDRIKDVLEMTVKISVGTAFLDALGPIGKLVSKGVHAYYGAQGITNMSAIAGLATFLTNAAGVNNIVDARVWALMALPAIGDAQQLLDTVISTPAALGSHMAVDALLTRIREGRPSSTKEMADMVRPLMTDPAAGPAIREGMRAELAELAAKGINEKNPTEEYKQIKSLSAYLDEHYTGLEPNKSTKPPVEDVPLKSDVAKTEAAKSLDNLTTVKTPEQLAELRSVIPPELQGVAMTHNKTLSGETVRVYFEDGKAKIEFGSKATPENIKEHVGVLRELSKYEGVMGSIRRLIARIANVIKLKPDFGTEGYQAQLELQKLSGIIEKRIERLNTDPKLANNPDEVSKIQREIDDLNRQYLDYLQKVDSFEEGTGFIAAEDNRSAGEAMRQKLKLDPAPDGYYWRKSRTGDLELVNYEGKTIKRGKEEFVKKYDEKSKKVIEVNVKDIVRNADDAQFTAKTWSGAFTELGGRNKSESFGIFVDKLNSEFGIGYDEVIDKMSTTDKGQSRGKSPEGQGMRTVRHTTKQYYVKSVILPHLTDEVNIAKSKDFKDLVKDGATKDEAFARISHQRMLDYTKGLDSSDKGGIAEAWYAKVYGEDSGSRQVDVDPKFIKKQGGAINEPRKLDRLEGDTIIELKNVTDSLGAREKGEFIDHVNMIGKKVEEGGTTIKKVRWVMLDPEGAFANREWIQKSLKATSNVTFVVFSTTGEPMPISSRNTSMLSTPAKFKAFLDL